MGKENIHAGHRARLRQQMENADISKMPDHIVLEYMLSFAQPCKDVNPLAHRLIQRFGSLSAVVDANVSELKTVTGVSDVTAHYLNMFAFLPRAIAVSRCKNDIKRVSSFAQTIEFLEKSIIITAKEEFYYITTDSSSCIIKFDTLGYGCAYEARVDIRELVRLLSDASTHSVIICHTHPHGNALPSREDISFTKALKNALDGIGIKLADHIIISPEGTYSFFKDGVLEKV